MNISPSPTLTAQHPPEPPAESVKERISKKFTRREPFNIPCADWSSSLSVLWGIPNPRMSSGKHSITSSRISSSRGHGAFPTRENGVTDVENAAHGLNTFKTGQVLSLQISWSEMIKREEVSVVFQGEKAGGKVERLFGADGVDETAIDTCELYVQENGRSVNCTIIPERCEDMGQIASAANFIAALQGKEVPLNTPEEALKLMRIIDAIYASAATGKSVSM